MGRNIIDDASLPLSPLQQGMLFHHLQEPHSGVDVEQLVVHLPEPIDAPRMAAAWQWLAARHDILRARMVWDEAASPRFDILPTLAIPLVVEDSLLLSADQRHERLGAFLESDRTRGFDLDRAPLLRLTLFRWAGASFSLIWTFHHSLLDGRTFPLLLGEVFEAYEELASGPIAPRPRPPAYRRHLEWLQQANDMATDDFWRRRLAGVTAPTPLVVDRRKAEPIAGARHGDVWAVLDADTTLTLRTLAQAHDVTMNALVMGAWAILLHRYSGDEDVIFGATRACRTSSVPDADRTIGLFINTVPVRVTLRAGDRVLAVIQAIRQQWLDARPHEHMPLARAKTVSEIPPSRPLFETLVVFERYRLDTMMHSLGGRWATRDVELHELTNLPVTLAAYDGDGLSLKIGFDRQRLEDDAAARMVGHLRCLLEGLAAHPAACVQDLPLLNAAERRQLIDAAAPMAIAPSRWSMPADGNATLHGLFEAQAARRPQAVALTCDGASITYVEVNARANRLARELVKHGIAPESLVGLYVSRSNDLVVAILAILKAGGAYLPLDPAYPVDRLAFMVNDAQAPLLLTERALAGSLPITGATTILLDEVLARPVEEGDEADLELAVSPDHLAYVIYTSGTTGKPKGTLITHRNVVRLFPACAAAYDFGEHDVWTLFHSCAFDFSVWELWGALLFGGRLVVVPFLVSRAPDAFSALLQSQQVSVLSQTPSAFRQLMLAEEASGRRVTSLRYVIFGGEALDLQMLRPWFAGHGDQQPQLVNMYGITETTVHVTWRRLFKEDLDSGSMIGVPLGDLRLHILDPRREPVPFGVPGEIYVGGAGLARGYLRRPELTDERFVPDPFAEAPGARLYRTGDLARRLSPHDVEYLGRIDDQVKIRGFRIELGEIEALLRQHPEVRDAIVVAREDAPDSKRLVAYVAAWSPLDVSALRVHLQQLLPDYMLPASFVFLDAFPLTAHGKIDRQALPAPAQHRPELAAGYVAPRSPSEQRLAAIWSRVLRVQQVGIHDNFFELGGDSILSIQVISQARQAGLMLSPKVLFAHPTIAALAAAVVTAAPLSDSLDSLDGDVPLTPIQAWFFEQSLDQMQHYNQALMLATAQPLDRTLLQSALDTLRVQHDALRLRYVHEATGWRQSYSDADEALPFTWIDLADVADAEQQRQLNTISIAAHATLDLEHGPLWRVVYIVLGAGRGGRLLFVVHHLAVDGVSWRPLLEDLETAYLQLAAGHAARLPAKTSSYKRWAERLHAFGGSDALAAELPYWRETLDSPGSAGITGAPPDLAHVEANTEGAAGTLHVALTDRETRALLQDVPAAYRTQINDALLTALLRSWTVETGGRVLATALEGHGREALFDDVDVSRTVGWFTAIFPVRLEAADVSPAEPWQPGAALTLVKEQIRGIPRRGIGYGLLRYSGAHPELAAPGEPAMLFNYLGQFDHVVAGSSLFRFAPESSGPWRSAVQQRRYGIELNCLVRDGQLELAWTFDQAHHAAAHIRRLANGMLDSLRALIAHCQSPGAFGRSRSDFPLARLTDAELDRLVAEHRDVEDIYPLSPVQSLFYTAGVAAGRTPFDQWQCTLRGALDVPQYQRAWHETVRRHSILRSTVHGEGVHGPVQLVHRDVALPWLIADWRGVPADLQVVRWAELLADDRRRPVDLERPPPMRFALVRVADQAWRFAWSLPALLLDGWSWPLVFGDVSRLYDACSSRVLPELEPVGQYRAYVEWRAAQSGAAGQAFWRQALAGFVEPTPLRRVTTDAEGDARDDGSCYASQLVALTTAASDELTSAARHAHLTLSALVQGAWALLLSHDTGSSDVVFGAAFNGRPTDLDNAATIAGPFATNLPVRVAVPAEAPVVSFFQQLHARLLELSAFQFTPLLEIQSASEVPWRHRLFESLVVVQNYAVDDADRRVGAAITVEDFIGPIHTNYPVLLLAEPGAALRLTLIYDRRLIASETAQAWARDLTALLTWIPAALAAPLSVGALQARLPPPTSGLAPARLAPARLRSLVPPQNEMEHTIAAICRQLFGLEQVGADERFFDLGGTSLLLMQMHRQLQDTLGAAFPIVTLFEHPTIRGLAQHLDRSADQPLTTANQFRQRAERQKQARSQVRVRAQGSRP